MRFQSKTEEEIIRENLLPEGTYDFEVVKAEEKESKKGNPMLEINMKVFRADGDGFIFVRDWLMEAFPMKLIHFCREVGLESRYADGVLTAEECVGRTGRVQIVQKQQDGFDPQNSVKDYGPGKGVAAKAKAETQEDPDDIVPF